MDVGGDPASFVREHERRGVTLAPAPLEAIEAPALDPNGSTVRSSRVTRGRLDRLALDRHRAEIGRSGRSTNSPTVPACGTFRHRSLDRIPDPHAHALSERALSLEKLASTAGNLPN
jgi:hypothetical protein